MNANDEFLRAFSMNGSFYILTVPKQKNILNIYVCGDGKKVDAGSYPIEMTTFYATLSSNNNNLNEAAESQVGIETVRSRLDNNIKSAYPKKKLYFQDNKIYLSFDEPNSTHLVIIDVYASKSFYKKLNFSLEQGNNSSEKRGNSFLYENKLFRATVSPEMLNISIIDLDSIRLINSYNIYPDIDITIANGPIKQESGMNTIITDEKVLHKTSQYFKRVLNGNLSIAANRSDSGRVVVEVGSYEEIITRSGGGFGTPGLSFGMGMGMGMGMGSVGFGNPYGFGNVFNPGFNGGPGSNYPFYNSGNGNMRLRFVSFKSLFSEPTYHHLEGKVPKMLHEKINDYLSNRFVHHTPELSIITPYREQKLLMGYYMKNVNKFEIIAFDKISNFP